MQDTDREAGIQVITKNELYSKKLIRTKEKVPNTNRVKQEQTHGQEQAGWMET